MRGILGVSVLVLGSLAACGTRGASFPDGSDVRAAEAGWCTALAKASGAGPAWNEKAVCLDAFPTGSGAYVRAMTACFETRQKGGKSELGAVVQECSEEVLIKVGGTSEDVATDLVNARCARSERCEKVAPDDCRKGFAALEAAQRALLTTAYNAGARARIAECLSSASCSDNEEVARDACYKPESDKFVWLP